MIHNRSSDPVLIKKISLKIWSLRDEIEARIQEKIDAGELAPEVLEDQIKELRSEYTQKLSTPDNVIQLKTNADGDVPESEEAVEAADSSENPTTETDDNDESNVVSMRAENSKEKASSEVIDIKIEPPAQLAEERISKGKTILSEISMEKMFFFSNRSFTEGQSIVIQFCIPKTFIVNADVIYCRPFNIKSRIISQNNYTHRMLIKFNFLKEGERALLRQFIQSIEPDVTKVLKKPAGQEDDAGKSNLNELDDLGL